MDNATRSYDEVIAPIEARMIRSIWQIVRNPQDAEDALQNALVTIWKRWDCVSQHPNPTALILKMCLDAAYDQVRRRMREHRTHNSSPNAISLADSSPAPDAVAEAAEQYHAFKSALATMPRQQATALLLRIVERQPYREIAQALNCGEATARKHVARGRERLRTALSRFLSHDAKASR